MLHKPALEEKKTAKERLLARWRRGGLWMGDATIVLEGAYRLTVRGCRGILRYSQEEICLSTGRRSLCVRGEEMLCRSFSGGALTVTGCIHSLHYPTAEDGEEGSM